MEIDALYVGKSNAKLNIYRGDKSGDYLMFALTRERDKLGEYRVVFI